MTVFYAQLNTNGICIGVSQLTGIINHPSLIQIEAFDESYLGRRYEKGAWVKEE
jgi:hypothetical protein